MLMIMCFAIGLAMLFVKPIEDFLLAIIAVYLSLALTACPPPGPPAPIPPDATDAAPTPTVDASPVSYPCQGACSVLTAYCGPQLPDCAAVYTHIESTRERREPSGKALTCADIAMATSAATIRVLGIPCGQ
jgi:hypothetical protein